MLSETLERWHAMALTVLVRRLEPVGGRFGRAYLPCSAPVPTYGAPRCELAL